MTPAICAGAGRRPLVGAEAPEALRAREQGDITALLSRFSFPSSGAGSGASQEAGRGRTVFPPAGLSPGSGGAWPHTERG